MIVILPRKLNYFLENDTNFKLTLKCVCNESVYLNIPIKKEGGVILIKML
ncbi:hypothetical protein A35E_00251 [secondary endosymbiont of Heteropsylla cubana]|uniref:Uncharacterized protein n=1 Tax=secondary endosymbiont of Heteropsylla cubana TaxID=134287 RepID=J3TYR6_9ENTR|nr:hypothetical protein A35E_00251 [secondary endosymbiont of Heteropsylla cubana]